jgi:hypothetical protein
MEHVVGESSNLRKTSLEMVRLLERILIISSNISMMFDESLDK